MVVVVVLVPVVVVVVEPDGGAFGDTLADDCELWSRQVVHVADDMLTTRQKIRRYFTDFT